MQTASTEVEGRERVAVMADTWAISGSNAIAGRSSGQRESEGRGREGVVTSASAQRWNRGRARGSPQ
jgi:hypothetical protein